MILLWPSWYLHQLLQHHEVSQRHLLAVEEGPAPQELVLQPLQCPVRGGPVALHLLLSHMDPNEWCQHLMGAKGGLRLWSLPPPGSLTVNNPQMALLTWVHKGTPKVSQMQSA